jgi:DNA repair protein RecO (recombination protein O)
VVGLGRDSGRFSAVVKGARKGKTRLAGLLEPPVELEGSLRPGRNLDGLSQLQLRRAFAGLRQNLDGLLAAGFLSRLFTEALPERSPSEGAFELFGNLLERLTARSNVAVTALWGQDRLLLELGIPPQIEICLGCGSDQVRGYSPRDGGMLCASCYCGSGFAVPAGVLDGLRNLRGLEADDPLPTMNPATVREIGRIYKQQFQQHLGLPDRVFRPVLPKRPS